MSVARRGEPAASVAAVVLAGGAAVRLGGVDKGLQLLAGRPMVEWVVERIRPQVARYYISANRNAQDYARYGAVIADAPGPRRGPLAGLCSAFARSAEAWLLSAPVDCPTPPPQLAERLLAACAATGASAACLHDGERRQPLFGLYRAEHAGSAAAALQEGWGVWQWQEEIGCISVSFADVTAAFVNLNTPEDFVQFEARHER